MLLKTYTEKHLLIIQRLALGCRSMLAARSFYTSKKGSLVVVLWKTFGWKCCSAGFQPAPLFLSALVSAELVPCYLVRRSAVPTPLKCNWSCAVWISSSGSASDMKLMEKLDLFLTVFCSLDWKWDSLLTLKVHRYSGGISRQWEGFL